MAVDHRLHWIWLQSALGAGCPQTGALLRRFGTAFEVYQADPRELAACGLSAAQIKRLENRDLHPAAQCLYETLRIGGWVLTPEDARFPSQLRGIYAMPLVLYGRGWMPDMETIPSVTIVGTRRCSPYGLRMATELAAGLAAGGLCVVSGGAIGVDGAALRAALAQGGTTICLQGCGLDINYPAENEDMRRAVAQTGAVLTEFPLGMPARRQNFPIRNRLLSGLTQGTCVVEAPAGSGALITARYALEQGRDVFAVPGAAYMPSMAGCNELIRDGAHLVSCAADVMEEYRPRFENRLDFEAAAAAERAAGGIKPSLLRVADSRQANEPPKSRSGCQPKRAGRPVRRAVSEKPAPPENPAPAPTAVCPDYVSETARQIYAVLTAEPQLLDDISARLSLPTNRVLAALTELEIAGCAAGDAGGRYHLK